MPIPKTGAREYDTLSQDCKNRSINLPSLRTIELLDELEMQIAVARGRVDELRQQDAGQQDAAQQLEDATAALKQAEESRDQLLLEIPAPW